MLRPPWWSVEESDPAEVSRLGEGSRWSSNGSQGGPRYCEPPNYFKRSTNLQGLLTQQKGEYDTEQLLFSFGTSSSFAPSSLASFSPSAPPSLAPPSCSDLP
ncbi:hypothetical protein DPX16_5886 [Anabarilius grahami]|uniref:Uncharacterized protein n=1 Tax=Anabarilius grahami TaxID=495550 RepID=A0A3N0Y2Y0_ANAGA|nr:hypothetical protein DPX16_5886 [Anabarilius grahami]